MVSRVCGCNACCDVVAFGVCFDPSKLDGVGPFGKDGLVDGLPEVSISLEAPCFA